MRAFCMVAGVLFFLSSCGDTPVGPTSRVVVNAGTDTSLYILDTLTMRGTATFPGDTAVVFRWDFQGDGVFDDSIVVGDTTADSNAVFVIPETTATTISAIVQAENTTGDKAEDTLAITVLPDSIVLSAKRSYAPDSTLLWYTTFVYGSSNQIMKDVRWEADTVTGWAILTYSGGKLSKKEHYNADSSKAETQEFLPTRENLFLNTGALYGYDSLVYSGNHVSETIFFTADDVERYRIAHTYSSGLLTKKTYSSDSSAILDGSYVNYEYGEKNRLKNERFFSKAGMATGFYEYVYGALRRLKE